MKLTEELCAVVKGRIAAALSYQDAMWANQEAGTADNFPDKPARWLAAVQGQYWLNQRGAGVPRRFSNQILPKLRSKSDALTAGDTTFFAEPLMEEFQGQEKDVAALMTVTWRAKQFDIPCNRARWDSDVYSFGVVEVGWEWERGGERMQGDRGEPQPLDDAVPMPLDSEMPEVVQEYETEAEAEAAARRATLAEDKQIWGKPTIDDPFVERFSPRHLLVDPNCTCWNLSDARYAFRVRWQVTSRLKADKNLSNTSDLNGTVYSIRDGDSRGALAASDNAAVKDDRALTKVFDGYLFIDANDDGAEEFLHVIMTDEHDKPLLVQECPYTNDDGGPLFPVNPFPFRIFPGLIADNDTWMPESAVDQAIPIQLAYDESTSQFNDQRRKSPRQYLAPKGALDNTAIRKLEAGTDGAIIEAEPGLKDQITAFPHVPIRSEIYQSMESLPIEIGRQLGVSPYEEATLPQKDMTKAEVTTLANLGGGRTGGDGKRFRKAKEDVAMCILVLIQHFGDRARSYSMQMPDGSRKWGQMRNTDLRGTDETGEMLPPGIQWRIGIDASSEAPKNKQLDQETKLKLLEVMARFAAVADPQTGQPMVNIKPVLRMVWEAFDEGDVNSVIPADPTPEELAAIQEQQAAAQAAELAAAQTQQDHVDAQQGEAASREQQTHQMEQFKTIADILSKVPPEILQALVAQVTGGQTVPEVRSNEQTRTGQRGDRPQ